jgi:hypothetical protein
LQGIILFCTDSSYKIWGGLSFFKIKQQHTNPKQQTTTMNITNIFLDNAGLIVSYLGTGISATWLYFTSKKNKALEAQLLQKQVEDNALDVTAKNMRLYQDMMDDIKKRFEATIEEYRADVDRLKLLLEESRETIGRQETFLREKNEELNRLRGILVEHEIDFDNEK